ncbi:hypothetical protein TraAM80_05278 [Trypanosoma rangeli]|uniref:Uncharacterized protein n=1 Tax=Trypanosoma rangeli TaxID=5698 RepID=A0A422NFC1_TRYRA|nr:uncharacterized protein TraAM80_05278 [Trypanosoma rangeli]RNF04174.1 hypothetical protein TraAM80_05278 [Trypanosoma rangeli]|eukprot:RNF04174.1 hypothetical protein TraAM80_05278 [Trypanosoma rangeli]
MPVTRALITKPAAWSSLERRRNAITKPRTESDLANTSDPLVLTHTTSLSSAPHHHQVSTLWDEREHEASTSPHKGPCMLIGCHGYAVNDGVAPRPNGCENTQSVAFVPHKNECAEACCSSCGAPVPDGSLRLTVLDPWGQNEEAASNYLGGHFEGSEGERQQRAFTAERGPSISSSRKNVCPTDDGVDLLRRHHSKRSLRAGALEDGADTGRYPFKETEDNALLSSGVDEECGAQQGSAHTSTPACTRASAIAISLFQRLLGQTMLSQYFNAWWRFILLKTHKPKGTNALALAAPGAASQGSDPSRYHVSAPAHFEASRIPLGWREFSESPEFIGSTAFVGEEVLRAGPNFGHLFTASGERGTHSSRCLVSMNPALSGELTECLSLSPTHQRSLVPRRLRHRGIDGRSRQGGLDHTHVARPLDWSGLLEGEEVAARISLKGEEARQRCELQSNAQCVMDNLLMIALCGKRRVSLPVSLRAKAFVQVEEADTIENCSTPHFVEANQLRLPLRPRTKWEGGVPFSGGTAVSPGAEGHASYRDRTPISSDKYTREGSLGEAPAEPQLEKVLAAAASTPETHLSRNKFPDPPLHDNFYMDCDEWKGEGLPCSDHTHGLSSSPGAEVNTGVPQGTQEVVFPLPTAGAVAPTQSTPQREIEYTTANTPITLARTNRKGLPLTVPDGLWCSELHIRERLRRRQLVAKYCEGLELIIYACFSDAVQLA